MLDHIGLNFPLIAYRELTGDPMPPKAIETDTNVHFWYAYEDLLAIRNYIQTKQLRFGEVLASIRVPKVEAVYQRGDAKPFHSFMKMIAKKMWASVKRKWTR